MKAEKEAPPHDTPSILDSRAMTLLFTCYLIPAILSRYSESGVITMSVTS